MRLTGDRTLSNLGIQRGYNNTARKSWMDTGADKDGTPLQLKLSDNLLSARGFCFSNRLKRISVRSRHV